jgi:hypothetical protein
MRKRVVQVVNQGTRGVYMDFLFYHTPAYSQVHTVDVVTHHGGKMG